MDVSSYKELLGEYDALGSYATSVSSSLAGSSAANERQEYGEKIFVKLLAHAITLRRLAPNPDQPGQELWDLSSCCAIARSLIEAYDALDYIALAPVADDQHRLRVLAWELHDANRRRKLLQHIGSKDPRFAEILHKEELLHKRVTEHALFSGLSKNVRAHIEDHDPPVFLNSKRERCASAGIDYDYFNAATMHLSQFVHTQPFALHTLFSFKAGNAEALRLMSLPLQYSLAFLGRAVTGARALFPGKTPEPHAAVAMTITVWTAVSTNGLKALD